MFLTDQFESRIKGITNATQETIRDITDEMKHFFLASDWENIEHYRKRHRYMWDETSENEDEEEEEEL